MDSSAYVWNQSAVRGVIHAEIDKGKEDSCQPPSVDPRSAPRLLYSDNMIRARLV